MHKFLLPDGPFDASIGTGHAVKAADGLGRSGFDRRLLLAVLRKSRRILAVVFVLALVIAGVVNRFSPNSYKVEMIVTAARYTGDTKPVSSVSPISLLTRPDTGELSDFSLYLEMLTSVATADRIMKNHPEIVIPLFGAEWHGAKWGPPRDLKQTIKGAISGLLGISAWSPPDAWRLSALLAGMVTTKKDGRNPIARISVRTNDRQLGINLLQSLHEETEAALKQSALERSETKAKYLLSVVEQTSVNDLSGQIRQTLTRTQMSAALSRSPVPFAAEFIAPPDGPASPSLTPKVVAMLAAAFACTLLAVLGLLFLEWRKLGYPWPIWQPKSKTK